MRTLTIGTRGSELAMWQARHVRSELLRIGGELSVELKVIRTTGDRSASAPLPGKAEIGLFTREIKFALLHGEIDLAVHSLKDLPTEGPEGLTVAAIPSREDPADALVAKNGWTLRLLPRGATVLTGSPRRRAQLLHLRGDLKVAPVRGNVPTRLRKVAESGAAATVLARAGLIRLGRHDAVTERLDPAEFVPACGQGALAVEIRRDDAELAALVGGLDDSPTRSAVTAERALLASVEGGCQLPVGAYAIVEAGSLNVTGMVADLDGRTLIRRSLAGPLEDGSPERLGRRLAEEILEAGGREVLRRARVAAGQEGGEQ